MDTIMGILRYLENHIMFIAFEAEIYFLQGQTPSLSSLPTPCNGNVLFNGLGPRVAGSPSRSHPLPYSSVCPIDMLKPPSSSHTARSSGQRPPSALGTQAGLDKAGHCRVLRAETCLPCVRLPLLPAPHIQAPEKGDPLQGHRGRILPLLPASRP